MQFWKRLLFPPGKPVPPDAPEHGVYLLLWVVVWVAIYLNSYASWLTGYY